ncbi:MAG: hypothetical protein RL264_589 [Bacteroidota bacterium]|jgi:type I restriction enzyme S subunit
MELTKTKYKQTDVGLVPEDWKFINVGEAIDLGYIEAPKDGNHGNIHPKKSDFVSSGIPFIMANNVFDNKVDLLNCHFISKKQADSLQKGFSIEGDVLLTHKGTVGNVAIVQDIKTPYIMLTPQVTYYRVNPKKIFNKFLKSYFETNGFQKVLEMLSGGGTRAYIGIVKQRELPLIIPPTLTEQKAIATALSDVDALISSLERLITKKKAIKQGAMQELLTPPNKGGKRLLGFSGEWEEKTLGDICRINMGQSPLSSNYNNSGNGLPLIQGNADIKERKTIIRSYTSQITKTAEEGDIVMSVRAPVGEVAIATFNCCIGRGVCSIKYPNEFLYHYLIYLESSWGKFSTGSTFDSINSSQLKGLEITIPMEKIEQQAIAKILTDMDAEIEALEAKKEKYKGIKQGMMQELLTGKTRLV